jgi:DNA-binding NarL/FixJ family response regulator
MITLVFADNHPVVRAGIRTILSAAQDIQIVGEAENGNDVQQLVAQLRPRILLLDLKMPGPPTAEIGRWGGCAPTFQKLPRWFQPLTIRMLILSA